jgi:hypothetical protein
MNFVNFLKRYLFCRGGRHVHKKWYRMTISTIYHRLVCVHLPPVELHPFLVIGFRTVHSTTQPRVQVVCNALDKRGSLFHELPRTMTRLKDETVFREWEEQERLFW